VVVEEVKDRLPAESSPPLQLIIKLSGFLHPSPQERVSRHILTLAFPGDEKQYTFLLTDMQIVFPKKPPGDILSEIQHSTLYLHAGEQDVVEQIISATPSEQLTLLARYSRGGRMLFVQNVWKSEMPR